MVVNYVSAIYSFEISISVLYSVRTTRLMIVHNIELLHPSFIPSYNIYVYKFHRFEWKSDLANLLMIFKKTSSKVKFLHVSSDFIHR